MSALDPATAQALALATRIEEKAEQVLLPLVREMRILNWPADYRAIMWAAVASKAQQHASRAAED